LRYPTDTGAKLSLACVYGQRGLQDAKKREQCLELLGQVFRDDTEERDTARRLMKPGFDFAGWADDKDFQQLVNPRVGAG